MQDNTATIDTQQSDSLRNIVLGCYAASLLGPFISIGMLNVPVMLVAWFYSSRARDTTYEDHLKQLIQTPLICLVLMVVVIFTRSACCSRSSGILLPQERSRWSRGEGYPPSVKPSLAPRP